MAISIGGQLIAFILVTSLAGGIFEFSDPCHRHTDISLPAFKVYREQGGRHVRCLWCIGSYFQRWSLPNISPMMIIKGNSQNINFGFSMMIYITPACFRGMSKRWMNTANITRDLFHRTKLQADMQISSLRHSDASSRQRMFFTGSHNDLSPVRCDAEPF